MALRAKIAISQSGKVPCVRIFCTCLTLALSQKREDIFYRVAPERGFVHEEQALSVLPKDIATPGTVKLWESPDRAGDLPKRNQLIRPRAGMQNDGGHPNGGR